jgi:hypothetical protein
MVGLELKLRLVDLCHWHFGAPAKNRRELAIVIRCQMHDHHIGDPEISRYGLEELA